jgi:Fibronectin type III domain
MIFDPDATPPTVPSILSVTAVGQGRLDIVWTVATDTGGAGLAGYDLLKDGATVVQLGNQTSYSDTGLTPGSAHTYRVRGRDGAGNVSAYSTQASGTVASAPSTYNPDYPRFGSYALGGTQNADNAALAECHINVIPYYPGWEGSRGPLQTKVTAVKGLSTIGTIVVPYTITVDALDAWGTPPQAMWEWYNQLTVNQWFVYSNGLTHTGKVVGSAAGWSKPNYTTSCPLVAGDTAAQWKTKWDYKLLYTGGAFSNGSSTLTVTACNAIDGKYDDNVFAHERSDGDYNVDGVSELASSAGNISLIQSSHAANLAYWKTLAPSTSMALANCADWPIWYPGGVTGLPIDQLYDGGVLENIDEWINGVRGTTAAALFGAIKVCQDAFRGPKLGILEIQVTAATNYAQLRYWHCIAALTGTYYYPHLTSGYLAQELGTINYDERRFSLGPALTDATGVPQWTPRYQSGANGTGIYRRDFAGGIVLWAAPGATYSAQSLGGTFYALLGTLDAATNNGQTITTVTMTGGTGVVYARTSQDTIAPSAPSSLAASAVSSSTINLSWNASTDTGGSGLAGYRVERSLNGTSGWAEIAQPATTSYSDTGRSASTQYFYRVRAIDAAGNLSAYSSNANATTLAASGNTLTHGQTATITGSGFGTQSAPVIYEDCTGSVGNWTTAYPVNAAARAGSNMAYRSSPFTRPWGSGAAAVTAPGRYTNLAAGGNDSPSGSDYATYRNGFSRTFTIPAFPFYTLSRWWERLDSLYPDGQRNFKVWDWSVNEQYNLPNNWYIDLQPGSVPTSTSSPTYEINDDSSVGIRGSPGTNGVVGNWHSTLASHYYGVGGSSLRNNWLLREVWVLHSSSGRVGMYEGSGIPSAVIDTGFTCNTADGWGGNQRNISMGAYNDPSQDCWRYFAGMFISVGPKALYLTNSQNWSTSTVRDIQGSVTTWGDTSISLSKVEGGRLASGSTVWAHVRSAPWVTQSDATSLASYTLS